MGYSHNTGADLNNFTVSSLSEGAFIFHMTSYQGQYMGWLHCPLEKWHTDCHPELYYIYTGSVMRLETTPTWLPTHFHSSGFPPEAVDWGQDNPDGKPIDADLR